MNLTDAQRRAVTHRGSDLLVAASAGSGKTEVLARRCVELIADPDRPAEIERMAIVTFTRAAAAELRERVARMLRERAAATTDARLRRHLRTQELLVGLAEIGTIDAWCGRIVREHFVEAGVDAGFAILSEQDATILRTRVLEELFEWVYVDADTVAQQARAWLHSGPTPSDEPLKRAVLALNRYREHLVDPAAWLAIQRDRSATPELAHGEAQRLLADGLRRECAFQYRELQAAAQAGYTLDAELNAYATMLREWEAELHSSERIENVVANIAFWRWPRAKPGVPRGEFTTVVRDRWFKRRLQEGWDSARIETLLEHASRAAERVSALLALEQEYERRLRDAKRERTAYEFADVLRFALDLLGTPTDNSGPRKPTPIAEGLRRRYEHIFIDEFQDTSPVQVEILRLLARETPETTNRFLVGDVKQSIYGFRRAEPRLFVELRETLLAKEADGRVEYLADNFRSHSAVLEPLNAIFEALFDAQLGGAAYGEEERLVARRAEAAQSPLDDAPRVEVVIVDADAIPHDAAGDDADEAEAAEGDAKSNAEELERIEREALLAADEIAALLTRGAIVPERTETGVELRPARYGDFAILLRAAQKNAGYVARCLRERGIPAITNGRESILDTLEGIDLRAVLGLLSNRQQDLALAAYLRSPLVGIDEPELLAIRRMAAHGGYFDAVAIYLKAGANADLRRRLHKAMTQLDAWREASHELELPALLRRIVRDSGYEHFIRALTGGVHRAATLEALIAFAEQFSAAGNQGVAEFAQYLDALAEEEVEPPAAIAAVGDAVHVMTIHASKGLEFPFVFVLNVGAKFNRRSQAEDLHADPQVGLGIRTSDYELRATVQSAAHFVLARVRGQDSLSEELRLLYVAATRARERLWLVGHSTTDKWSGYQAQHANRPIPLISRLSAATMFEWVLMAVASRGLHRLPPGDAAHLLVRIAPPTASTPATKPADEPATPAWTPADEAWVSESLRLLRAQPDMRAAVTPAVLSVSMLKDQARREREADTPNYVDALPASLIRPAFAHTEATPDSRDIGTTTHRFLELADLRRLASANEIQSQLDAFAAAGRISSDDAAQMSVADIAWFGQTPEARFVAAHAEDCRRELPFVFEHCGDGDIEPMIVRGVIDCVVQEPDGLTILDYKTDRVRDEAMLRDRIATYGVQLALYARAAAAVLDAPVKRAILVFLAARRVADVPLPNA